MRIITGSMSHIGSIIAFAMAVLFVLTFEAKSESGNSIARNYCETLWLDLVSDVESLIAADSPGESAILFSGADGRVFNCLNQALPDSAIQESQLWTMSLSRAIASNPFNDDGPPSDFCNSSYGAVQGIQIMTIHLPYDGDEMDSQACTIRLRGLPDRVKQFLETK